MIINEQYGMTFTSTLTEQGFIDGITLKPFTGKAIELSADYRAMYAVGLEKALNLSLAGNIERTI